MSNELISTVILVLFIISLLINFIVLVRQSRLRSEIDTMANDKFQKWKDLEMDKFRKYTEKKETETASAKLSLWKEEWKSKYEINIRADAISRSNSVILGQISENIAPFFPSFDYNPKDARFLGNPIDMIVFDGLHKNELKNIVFLEIKTGNAKFNKHQRLIREAVISKKVLFREFRI